MEARFRNRMIWLQPALVCALAVQAQAGLIANGGFEAGLAGWTRVDQIGSEGTFFIQEGAESPLNSFAVPAPPEGTRAAMSDAEGPGSHVLFQDFAVPALLSAPFVATFSLFVNNGASDFFVADDLDFATPALNQQARVDIMTATADPFSVAAGDVLQNLYQTQPGDPLVAGYTVFHTDVTGLLQAHAGQTLRLRIAEVDNVFTFNLGVDNVDVAVIPEPSTWMLMAGALLAIGWTRLRRA